VHSASDPHSQANTCDQFQLPMSPVYPNKFPVIRKIVTLCRAAAERLVRSSQSWSTTYIRLQTTFSVNGTKIYVAVWSPPQNMDPAFISETVQNSMLAVALQLSSQTIFIQNMFLIQEVGHFFEGILFTISCVALIFMSKYHSHVIAPYDLLKRCVQYVQLWF
jgi:hypothetical protein